MEYRAEAVFLGLGVFEVGLRGVWVLRGGGLLEWFMVSSCAGCGSEKLCLSFPCELLRV